MDKQILTLSTDHLLSNLDAKIDTAFRNQLIMAIYQSIPRKYGQHIMLTEIEMHALGYIQNAPGITAKKLGEMMYRTKGTISSIINRLEKEGFLTQTINPINRREHQLYLTDKGADACNQHISFDRQKTSEFIIYLSQYCTPEEIDGFFKVLHYRTEFFEKAIQNDRDDYKILKKATKKAD